MCLSMRPDKRVCHFCRKHAGNRTGCGRQQAIKESIIKAKNHSDAIGVILCCILKNNMIHSPENNIFFRPSF